MNLVLLCRPCHNKAERGVVPSPHPYLESPSTATSIEAFLRVLETV